MGADVRPLSLVRSIETTADGYLVRVDRLDRGVVRPTTEAARLVVLAAGSLGSTELLLRSRDLTRTLPGLPAALGSRWSANGDFLTIGIHPTRDVRPTDGPTITSAIDFRDGSSGGRPFLIEDGGFPDLFATYARGQGRSRNPWRRRRLLRSPTDRLCRESA